MEPVHDTTALSDGYEAHARWWLPPSPSAGVLYLHGIESHGGWFEASASRLAEAGLAVVLPDRRGSGCNQVDRGHARSPLRLLADVAEHTATLRQRAKVDRIHIVGVSWGGKLAAAAIAAMPEGFDSLTMIAPGLFPRVDLPIAMKGLVAAAAVMAPRTKFRIPLRDPTLFTENPCRQVFIRDDPLRLHAVTARFLVASRQLDWLARRLPRRSLAKPVRVFLAQQDRIIKNEPTRRYVRSLGAADAAIVEYRGASHTLEFEADPGGFVADLAGWLTELSGRQSPDNPARNRQ